MLLTRRTRCLLTSRQGLPRPARLYSTPTKSTQSPAAATAAAPPPVVYPPPMVQDYRSPSAVEMHHFLRRKTSFTVLPTPLPDDSSSQVNDLFYTDSPTQDTLAIISACLHGLHDVPRAKEVFNRLRKERPHDPVLEPRLYNSMLEAYVGMACTKGADGKDVWLHDTADLYNVMESGKERTHPVEGTYAVMLMAWHRFSSDSSVEGESGVATLPSPEQLLGPIVERSLSVSSIITDRAFTSSEEVAGIIKSLSKAAVTLSMSHVVSELGRSEVIGQYSSDPLEGVPEALPVRKHSSLQKSALGDEVDAASQEAEVPFNLDNLRKHLAQVLLAKRVLPEDVASRQKLLEESVYDVALERLRHQIETLAQLGLGSAALNKSSDLQKWMWDWHCKLKVRLQTEVESIIRQEKIKMKENHVPLGPFLSLVAPERLSLIAILEVMRLQGSGGVAEGMKTTRALISIGKAVENEYKARMCKKNNLQVPSSLLPRGANNQAFSGKMGSSLFSQAGYTDLHKRRLVARKYIEDSEGWTTSWTQGTRAKVGSILVECLMDMAEVTRVGKDKVTGEKVSEVQPAFYHSYEYVRGQKLGVIRLNPIVSERIAQDSVKETVHPRHLPMLVRPKPWVSHNQGGYLFNPSSVMRFKDSQEQLSYLKRASDMGNMELVYAGLDVLGVTPWRVNRAIFDVVLAVWNSGNRLGKLPPAALEYPEPERPENYETDLKARSVYLHRQKAYNQAKANNHSDRCSVNYKIEIARAFLGDEFYQPHNIDFRGRAYPIPPHLNHMGDDLSRGLLKFAESKPLGKRGLRWLKIHLANLYGYDKASFDERVQWVMDRLEDIYDSADHPLEGRGWWKRADDPWQCLATCMELKGALTSPDAEAFESSLPVHQDGTCNGLQHYAALGGDARGAAQVNLAAGDRPSDVYTHVGDMVLKLVLADVEKGVAEAVLLQDKITRKVVKQTVMTTVYGVTFIGAREQIERQLKERGDIPQESCWAASSYLAKKVLFCIGDLFSGAKAIQTWLNLAARLISRSIPDERLQQATSELKAARAKSGPKKKLISSANKNTLRMSKELMTSVIWTTPLGLPVVQPYRKAKRKQIMTSLQTIFISDPASHSEVNSMKQASAFPPNFIHSLDATHMMLTAIECRNQDITFAAVHDSYWTHACDIDDMSGIIRDTFIALHSSDVLHKIHEEFLERYRGYKVPLHFLTSGSLSKALVSAGSRVVATREQAESLTALGKLVKIDNDAEHSTIDEAAVESSELRKLVDILNESKGSASDSDSLATSSEELESEEAGGFEADSEEDPIPKNPKAKLAGGIGLEQVALLGKFVDLTALLPPLPKKGNFKVDEIKRSQYFFS